MNFIKKFISFPPYQTYKIDPSHTSKIKYDRLNFTFMIIKVSIIFGALIAGI